MTASSSTIDITGERPATVQLQSPDGVAQAPEVTSSPSDPAMLRKLYAAMLRCRMVEERVEALAQSHRLKTLSRVPRGCDASTVGSLIELRAGDAVASDLGYAQRMFAGQPLGLYFAELYGVRAEYLAFAPPAADTAIHLLPPVQTVAAQLNMAAGFALAMKKSQQRNVVLVHLPDGANALGYWHEAVSLAATERLPIIFVGIRESVRPGLIGNGCVRQRAATYNIPAIAVDGGDAVAMWRVTQESIYRARAGAGATLIDAQVPAVTANSKTHADDPLARMQRYLEKRQLWEGSWKRDLAQTFAAEITEAQSFFSRTGEPQ